MRSLLRHPLILLTDAALADSILGDLEELRKRRAEGAPFRALIWFWRAAVGLLIYVLAARVRERVRSFVRARGGGRGVGGDLQHAMRSMRRNPGFAAGAVLLLALGVGANTAVFSIVRGVMLRPLPYDRPDELVFLWGGTVTDPDNRHNIMTGTDVTEIARHQTTLESFATFQAWNIGLDGQIDLLRRDGSDRLRGAHVTPNFFELLGVPASRGRTFSSSDTEAAPVAVISHGLWQRRFGGDPNAVGSQILIAGGREARTKPAFTIVGVLPADFRFTYPEETEIYLSMPWTTIRPGRALKYAMVARLRPGITAADAQAELTVVAHNVTRGYGFSPEALEAVLKRTAIMAEPMRDHLIAPVTSGLTVLAAVAAVVLLITCVNVGLLMVSRTVDRTGELAVRAALGAGAARIGRLLLVEGTALAAAGGAVGVALAFLVQPALRALMPSVVPRTDQIAVDGRVLLFAMCATAVTALVCGLAPALVVVRRDLLTTVRRAGSTSTADRGLALLRMSIVGFQVALVFVLLVGAGLLLHSFWRLQNVPLGFAADDVLTFETRLLNPKYRVAGALAAFERELLSRIRQIPGVQTASTSTAVPMRGVDFLSVVGPRGGRARPGYSRTVDPAYFDIMEIPLVQGRLFTEDDRAGAPDVMVVSESYARLHFGRENPIGRRFEIGEKDVEIIGVVGDVRYSDVHRPPAAAFYLPRAQQPVELICVLVRPRPGMHAQVAAGLRSVVSAIDPDQPIQGLTTIGELVSDSTADRRFYAISTATFAVIALLLAIGGVFGLVSRSVTERRREIAIRIALGADRQQVLRLVLAYGLLPVVLGCLTGLIGAQAAARGLETLLFEITPADPIAYGAAAALVLVVAIGACLIPGWRALHIPAMGMLRE